MNLSFVCVMSFITSYPMYSVYIASHAKIKDRGEHVMPHCLI